MSRTIFEKPAETARMIKGNEKETALFVAEHNGDMWATNRYWMVPAERVTGYLGVNNLEPTTGTYDVNGRCSKRSDDAPNVSRILSDVLDGAELLTRAEIAGSPAYVQAGKRLAAVYTRSTGHVMCDATWADWITDRLPRRYGVQYVGAVRVYQRDGHKPLAFVISRQRIKPGTGIHAEPGRYVAQEWEDDGEELLGVLMPIRLP